MTLNSAWRSGAMKECPRHEGAYNILERLRIGLKAELQNAGVGCYGRKSLCRIAVTVSGRAASKLRAFGSHPVQSVEHVPHCIVGITW